MKLPIISTNPADWANSASPANPAKIIGIMSGTSHDGVDAALALIGLEGEGDTGYDAISEYDGISVRVLDHLHVPYTPELRDKISLAFTGDTNHLCRLNFELGEVFAEAALSLMKQSDCEPSSVEAIASHGQTVYHVPSTPGQSGSTLQIGEASVIAVKTGVLTISDFRTKDVALGGQGAPLVPIADYILFHKPGTVRAVLNIGGLSNVTIVGERPGDIVAFDIGPGNSLMDDLVRLHTSGRAWFDRDGSLAAGGKLIGELFDELLANPYFKELPPKSTGRELFGMALVRYVLAKYGNTKPEDLLCTFANLTATTICDAIAPYGPREVIATGGGCKNLFLMGLLREKMEGSGIALTEISHYGVSPEEKEAVCFALLGFLTLRGMAGNVPSATGASRGAILGKINLPG
ncbi:MAG: anhydro-N-acetylmuramic acid kinase [Nitrospirae bacterium]|nr:anhydro-N-acetylmuramic acid kinase [Nitrospirota bacterium]